MPLSCPLCNSQNLAGPDAIQKRHVWLCKSCDLLFIDPKERLNALSEKERYGHHENTINNTGYVSFLRQVIDPVLPLISSEDRILDFGCGPEPVLSQILDSEGYQCDNYDPFFFPIKPEGIYDLIFSTEVWEHFSHPAETLNYIDTLLAGNGELAIITELWDENTELGTWHYMRDPTHICFYSPGTLKWIATQFNYSIRYTDHKRVVVFKK